jgi:arylsulfate sulfotransferase
MKSANISMCALSLLIGLTACGGSKNDATSTTNGTSTSSSPTPSAPADFTLVMAPTTLSLVPGGSSQQVSITAAAVNGFAGNVSVAVGAMPTGVTASPMSLSLAPGAVSQLNVVAAPSAPAGNFTLSLQGASGSITHSVSAALAINPVAASATTTASLSASAFDFGDDLVNNTITQAVTTITNTGASGLTLNPTLSGDPSFSLVSAGSCGGQLAAAASCAMMVSYTPSSASTPAKQNALLNLGLGGVAASTPQTVAVAGTSAVMATGQVTTTDNPQVALYSMTLPYAGSMTVSFGKDTTYGTKTWTRTTPGTGGGPVSIFVAGMQGSSTYHMQASVQFANGVTATDADHTFITPAVPANMQPKIVATTTPGMTPQSGVELLDMLNGQPSGLAVADLAGNIIWTYPAPGPAANFIQGAKLLPNGDFLMSIGPNSSDPLSGIPAGTISEIREVNLAGDTVRSISMDDVNSLLASATCAECKVTLQSLHHDVEPLPNGHWLLLGNTTMNLSATTQPPLTNAPPATVLGDVIVDLDENLKPVWVWNAFNHLAPDHHPYMFPDWTHANAILYSKDDGNLLISMRHENIVYKLDYNDGNGSGAVIWRLGQGGNFTLKNGVDPTDWHYAQHYPSFFSSNTTGVFSLAVMDNGDDRIFAGDITCGAPNNPPCLYSTIPVYQIDETAMTATLVSHQILPASQYSYFGGSVNLLNNGNIEFDLSGVGAGSLVFEETPQSTPQTVWTMKAVGTYLYRAFRIPSMYPGTQW